MQDDIASKKVPPITGEVQATRQESVTSHHVNANKVRRAAENDLAAFWRLTIPSIPHNDCLHIYFDSHQHSIK
jgi:hypothetical protein